LRTWLAIVVCLVLALLGGQVRAAAPTVIPVQGTLTDAFGEPVIGTRTITFALYDDHTGGNQLWSETQQVTFNSGAFSVYLGSIQSLDLIMFKEHGNIWLGVAVENDPEFSRIQMGSIPFSAYSQHGSYTPGLGITITAGNVISNSLGDSIESEEITDGTILRADLAQDGCSAGQYLQFDGSGWSCADIVIPTPTLECLTEQCQVGGAVTGCTVSCPAGYTVTGCGARSNNSNFLRENAFNGNGCRCWIVNIGSQTTTCQARCCRLQ